MKTLTMTLTVLLVSIAGLSNASAKDSSCKVKTNDIGTIVGHGSDHEAAFEDAATQCFDRYSLLNKATNSRQPADDDAKLIWIDTCANIKCG